MKPTTIKQLQNIAQGQAVELPGFTGEAPFVCRLGRPSLIVLAQEGNIPNPLLSAAGELFKNGLQSKSAPFNELAQVMISVAKAAMLEPTYNQVTEAGLNLTDTQLLYIYMYASAGVDALRPFRYQQTATRDHQSSQSISDTAEQDAGN